MTNTPRLNASAWSREILERAQSALSHSDTLRRFVNLASWALISFALDKAAMLAIIFVLARILGTEDYGRLTLAQGLVNSLQVFIILGMGSVLGRYIPAMLEEGVQRAIELINLCATVVLGTTALFTIAAIAAGKSLTISILGLSAGSQLPYWLLVWVILTVATNFLLTVMLSFERGRALGFVSLLGAGLSVLVVPAMAAASGLQGAVTALVMIETAKLIALAVLYSKLVNDAGTRIFNPPSRADLPLLVSFGLPVFLQSALWAPTIWLAQLTIKTLAPGGLAAVGVFGLANNVLGAVVLVSSLTNRAALPILSSLQARGSFAELRRTSWLMTLSQIASATAVGLPLAMMAPFIMSQAGPSFAPHWPMLLIMIVAGIVIAGQTSLGNYLLVKDRPYFLLMTILPWGGVLIGAAVLFAPQGAYALAWGLLAASVIRTGLFFWGWTIRPANRTVEPESP